MLLFVQLIFTQSKGWEAVVAFKQQVAATFKKHCVLSYSLEEKEMSGIMHCKRLAVSFSNMLCLHCIDMSRKLIIKFLITN